MEKYSVLMSLYKNEKPEYLRQALESMLSQTIPPDEIVMVEDGPLTEALYEVLDSYGDKLKRVVNEKNLGLGLSLRKGLASCTNELVARMDTDDISVANRCEMQLKYFENNPTLDILGGQIQEFIGNQDNIIGKRIVPIEDGEIKQYMKRRCPFNHMTVMFKKSSVINSDGYKDLTYNEDYYLWIRMAEKNCKMANLKETLVHARVGDEMYLRRGGLKYFKSEKYIQKLMYSKKYISFPRFAINVALRFILQVCMPNKMRSFVFKSFARE